MYFIDELKNTDDIKDNTENLNAYNRRVVVPSDALERLLEVMSVGEALETL